MKIVVVAPVFWPATIYGGPVYTMTALVKALAARGEEVTVLTSNLGNSGKTDVQIGVPQDFYGARLIYLNQRRRPPYGPLEELKIYLDREARDADIIHISSTLTRTTWQAMRWAAYNRIPYVVTTRGHLIRRQWWKDIKKQIALEVFLKRYLRAAAFLQATSTLEADALKSYGFQNVKILSHGVELPETLPDKFEARLAWGIQSDEIVLVALGRIHPVKGLELMIKAVGKISKQGMKPRLLIAGRGNEAYVQSLQNLAAQQNIATQCQFVGQVAGDQKWSLLRAGDLFVHLSTGESFGLAIGEALGAGLPVLIGEKCSWDDVAELGFGRCVFRELDIVVFNLEFLLANKSRLKEMGDKASAWVQSHFQWDGIAEEMVSLYRRSIVDNYEVL